MATTYDPLKDALANTQQQSGIFTTAMQSPTASTTTTAAPAPAPAPAPPPSVGIVGAQSAQLQNPTAWNVTDDQTVEGRINKIINSGSPLLQQAQTRAKEQANARGLANTSMAVTAGEAALYESALPIAQADAATVAKAAGYNADQTNQFAVKNTDYENQFKLQDKTVQAEKDLALINRETQVQLTNLDAANKAEAARVTAQNQRVLETNAQAAEAFRTAMSAINNIQNNNQMDAGAKTEAVAQVWRDVQTQLKVMGAVSGLDLTSQLNFANYPGFDGSGTYVGFGGSGDYSYDGYGGGSSGGGSSGGSSGGGSTALPVGVPSAGRTATGQPLPRYTSSGAFINWEAPMQAVDGSRGTVRHAYEVAVQTAQFYGWRVPTAQEWYDAQIGSGESGGPGNGENGEGAGSGGGIGAGGDNF
jgi:hypothetical protein